MKKTTKMVAVLAAMSVMVLGAATMVSADEVQGWKQENNSWYYYVDGDRVANQWALSGGDWYYLGESGKMETNEFVGNIHAWDILDTDLVDAVNEEYYYVDATGKMVTGWLEIKNAKSTPYGSDETDWFYFGADGKMFADEWVEGAKAWYHVGKSGRMQTNLLFTDDEYRDYYLNYVDHKTYILNKDGAMITGWYKAKEDIKDLNGNVMVKKNEWTWANASGLAKDKGWEKIDGKWYFFGDENTDMSNVADYAMAKDKTFTETIVSTSGTTEIRNFRLLDSGAMVTGWYRTGRYADWEFYGSDGVQAIDEMKEISGRYYLFNGGTMEKEGQIFAKHKNADDNFQNFELISATGGTTAFTNARKSITSEWVAYELGTTRRGPKIN